MNWSVAILMCKSFSMLKTENRGNFSLPLFLLLIFLTMSFILIIQKNLNEGKISLYSGFLNKNPQRRTNMENYKMEIIFFKSKPLIILNFDNDTELKIDISWKKKIQNSEERHKRLPALSLHKH